MARNITYHMSEAYNLGYNDGWKDANDKACETYCKVCFNKTTDCKEFCNDLKIFREAISNE